MRKELPRIVFSVGLLALLALPVSAGWPPVYSENFDGLRSPLLPSSWVASQGVNVTGAPLWVASSVTPDTAPNDAFSTAPDNILDNRLDTPVLPLTGASFALRFSHSYNLEAGRDGAVLEISSPDINGGAFTDITDPAAHASLFPGYNTVISSGFQSPIAGRMAWSGNSGGYIITSVVFTSTIPSQAKLRFRLVSDNAGASAGWRIDTFVVSRTEGPTPTPSPPPSPTPTPTPISTPCDGGPNLIADSSFEAGTPWPAWTVQTSINFGTPLCDTASCGSGGTATPYSGSNWAWFGGASSLETATLGQTVSILAGGQATLSFEMRIAAVSSPLTDVLNVRMDGTIVQSYPEPANAETSYRLRTIDLSAFADGGTHNLLFEYVGNSIGGSSYSLDNITLTNTFGCATPTPSPTVTPTATPTATPTPSPATPTPTPTPSATAPPPTPTPTPTVTPPPGPAQALNISTRLRVEGGDRIAIGGFIITGIDPKKVAIRGIGPSLSNSGLSGVLADPTMELRDYNGALLVQNDNWQDNSAHAAELTALGLALQHPNESGIVATLLPGSYTVLLAGKNQTAGLALVEIYDADRAAASKLANLSTRGFVRTGDSVMIGGFILGHGAADSTVVVRGLGPSLSRFMLVDVLADPMLELRDANGAILIANDNWQDDPVSAAQLTGYNLEPYHALEPALLARLGPGAFTGILVGKNGDVGIALLELYTVPILVTSTADSGPGSLRDAIAAARDGDTIQFDPALNGQAITLTSGELLIDKSVVIKGFQLFPLPVQRSTAGGTPAFRIFHITPGRTVTIQGLAISNGFGTGGDPGQRGGGIYNDGSTLAVTYCVISGNSAGSTGIPGYGGGIFNNATGSGHADLTISNSIVSGNSALGNSGGGGIFNNGAGPLHHATVVLNYSTVSGNSASHGAGIYNNGFDAGDASLIVDNSTIGGNAATNGGGGISNEGTLMSGHASATVSNSTISGNSARFGGAIVNNGEGGSAMLEIVSTTISGNSAVEQGGGLYNTGGATPPHSPGGIYPVGSGGTGAVTIRSTILKTGDSGENIYNNLGEVNSAGYNFSSDNGGGFLNATGDQINTNPMIGPLQNNGGPTFTHAVLSGSPVINAGDPNLMSPPYDQRGFGYPRVMSSRIDVGSFEFEP